MTLSKAILIRQGDLCVFFCIKSLPGESLGKDFFYSPAKIYTRKEVGPLAVSKQRKDEILEGYKAWVDKSKAIVITEYKGLAVKDLDQLRQKMRDNGGEFHIVKNTLGKKIVQDAGYPVDDKMFTGSTAIGFAFEDPAALAKALSDYSNTSEFVKIKGGYLANNMMNAAQVKALADLPPLPVVRAQLLGVLNAPASKLVRTLAEPGRQIAAVIKAFADKDSAPAEA